MMPQTYQGHHSHTFNPDIIFHFINSGYNILLIIIY